MIENLVCQVSFLMYSLVSAIKGQNIPPLCSLEGIISPKNAVQTAKHEG